MPVIKNSDRDSDQYGLFHYNLVHSIGFLRVNCAIYATAIMSMWDAANIGEWTTVMNATDVPGGVPDETMWIFTFVKNPYDRTLASWNKLNVDFIADTATKVEKFRDDMLAMTTTIRDVEVDPGDYRPQEDLIRDTMGVNRLVRYPDFIGKVETFNTDILTVEAYLGIALDENEYATHRTYTMTNDTDTVFADTTYDGYLTYADAYNPATENLIYTYYREDFDNFSYPR